MTLSLKFRISLADLYQLSARPRFRVSTILRSLVAILSLPVIWNSFQSNGFGWQTCIFLLGGTYLVFPRASVFAFLTLWMGPYLIAFKPTIDILINEEGVASGSGGNSQTIPWSSFERSGRFRESATHFSLECGRGTVWIPKHAFATSADVAAFRDFVAQRLGAPGSFTRREEEATPDVVAHSS